MRVSYTAQAASNLSAIGDYLAERSPGGAKRVKAAIEATVATIAAFPRIGRLQPSRTSGS